MRQIEHDGEDDAQPTINLQSLVVVLLFVATAANSAMSIVALTKTGAFYKRVAAYSQHTEMRKEWESLNKDRKDDHENLRRYVEARMDKHSWEIEQLQTSGLIYEQWRDKTDASGRFTPQRFRTFAPKIHKRDEPEDQSPPWANPG